MTGSDLQAASAAGDVFVDFFKRLKACYPSWRSAIRSAEEDAEFKKQWLRGFAENGVDSVDKLSAGLEFARRDKSSWLPSVGQFIEWCKPSAESLGLPDVRSAYLEACHFKAGDVWSHDVVYFACRGWLYDLQIMSEARGFKRFEYHYGLVVKRMLAGDDLGGVPVALPSPDDVAGDPVPMPDGFADCLFSGGMIDGC